MKEWFRKFAVATAKATGSPWAFIIAFTSIIVWAVSKAMFPDTNAWMLVVNTMTTIVTFIMVFITQNSQNRDIAALQVKLDEIIRVTKPARNHLAGAEELPDEELEEVHKEMVELEDEAEGTSQKVKIVDNKVEKVDDRVDHVEDDVEEIKNGKH